MNGFKFNCMYTITYKISQIVSSLWDIWNSLQMVRSIRATTDSSGPHRTHLPSNSCFSNQSVFTCRTNYASSRHGNWRLATHVCMTMDRYIIIYLIYCYCDGRCKYFIDDYVIKEALQTKPLRIILLNFVLFNFGKTCLEWL